MAEYPRYLIDRPAFAHVPGSKGVRLVKASIYAKRAVNWHPDREPSRFFEPLNQAAVDQLQRLWKAQQVRAQEACSTAKEKKEAHPGWDPKPIPEDEGEVENELKLEHMKQQIEQLQKIVETKESEREEDHEAEKTNQGTADQAPIEAPAKPSKNPSDKSPVK